MGKRVSFGDLAEEAIVDAPVSPVLSNPQPPTSTSLAGVAYNPFNPREVPGDLESLVGSLQKMGQLQPVAVVTRGAFLAIHPEKEAEIGPQCDFVIVGGGRRRLAVEQAGLKLLEIVVKDHLARDPETFLLASLSENIDREPLTLIEEAETVAQLVKSFANYDQAAAHLKRSKGWISQRLILLKLTPEMRKLLLAKELTVKDARELGKLPAAEQLAAFHAVQAQRATKVQEKQQPALTPADVKQAEPTQPSSDSEARAGTTEALDDPQQDQAATQPGPSADAPAAASSSETVQQMPPVPNPRGEVAPPSRGTSSAAEDEPKRLAVRALGGTPELIARSLVDLLTPEEVGALSRLLAHAS